MSEQLADRPSPFPLDFMEDFVDREELTETENAEAVQTFDHLRDELRAKFGATHEHHPVKDGGPVIWLTRKRGGEVWDITLANYDEPEKDRADLPVIMIDHRDSAGIRDFDYHYERTADGVYRTLAHDRITDFTELTPEERLLLAIFGQKADVEGYYKQTEGFTTATEIDALKAFLLDCETEATE